MSRLGIVLVSHGVRVAEGAAKVERALGAAEAGAGVLVLPDLGSAVLTVRALLADLPDANVTLADAPFVEGAVAATVTAAAGDADHHLVLAGGQAC